MPAVSIVWAWGPVETCKSEHAADTYLTLDARTDGTGSGSEEEHKQRTASKNILQSLLSFPNHHVQRRAVANSSWLMHFLRKVLVPWMRSA